MMITIMELRREATQRETLAHFKRREP
jgi:hypothetical protein